MQRRNFALDFRRKLAAEVAKHFSDRFHRITRKIRKGSGNKKLRNHWVFANSLKFLSLWRTKHITINECLQTMFRVRIKESEVNDRHFRCECEDDRDVNAARNILKLDLKLNNRGAVNHSNYR